MEKVNTIKFNKIGKNCRPKLISEEIFGLETQYGIKGKASKHTFDFKRNERKKENLVFVF